MTIRLTDFARALAAPAAAGPATTAPAASGQATAVLAVPGLVAMLLLAPDGGAGAAAHGRGGASASFARTAPADILRGQRALESLGRLERGKYSPGEYDETTRWAIRSWQRRYGLVPSGLFDFDTFALLPIDGRPDADDDGVADEEDRCAATPKEGPKKTWTRVGHDGCPLDRKPS